MDFQSQSFMLLVLLLQRDNELYYLIKLIYTWILEANLYKITL